jgi:hypothetical protein
VSDQSAIDSKIFNIATFILSLVSWLEFFRNT